MKLLARFAVASLAAFLLTSLAGTARGAEAADFPPGAFSDGGRYKLSDFQGKALVLFFYEQDCPTCRGLIPERNKVVAQFKDRPVKFIAVGAGDPLPDVIGYVKGTKLNMPSFADPMGVMEYRYGQHLSLQNIYQFRVIGPDGQIVGMNMTPEEIEKGLVNVKWKYKDGGYDPKLNGVVDMLEWNQYEPALRALRPLAKGKGATADSANKLLEVVKAEGKAWLDEADKVKSSDPVKAYDLYAKAAACFAGDDMAKTADAAAKAMKKDKPVADELAARAMYDGLYTAMAKASPNRRGELIAYCQSIVKKYPDAPTAKKAADLAKDLEGAGLAMKK